MYVSVCVRVEFMEGMWYIFYVCVWFAVVCNRCWVCSKPWYMHCRYDVCGISLGMLIASVSVDSLTTGLDNGCVPYCLKLPPIDLL